MSIPPSRCCWLGRTKAARSGLVALLDVRAEFARVEHELDSGGLGETLGELLRRSGGACCGFVAPAATSREEGQRGDQKSKPRPAQEISP